MLPHLDRLDLQLRVLTSLRLVDSPFWRMMVQLDSQPSNFSWKALPSSTSKAVLRNLGWAATAVARAETATREYFMLSV